MMMCESQQTTFDSQAEPGFRETAELRELSVLGVRPQVELKTRQRTNFVDGRLSTSTRQPGATGRQAESEVAAKFTERIGLAAACHVHPEIDHVTTTAAGVAFPQPAVILGGTIDREGSVPILVEGAAARLLRITLEAQERPDRPDVHGAQEGDDVFAHFLGPGSPVLRM